MDQIKVELQSSMGNDRQIAEAAWTSSSDLQGKQTKTDEQVAKLVNMLADHRHATPFESVVFRFWIKMPIAIDRQHMTHRIACLTEDDLLYFDLPKTGKQKWKLFKMSIGDFVKKWNEGVTSKTRWGGVCTKSHKKRLQKMKLRCLNEDTKEFGHTTVKEIYNTGVQPVYKIKFDDGYEITSTLNHRYLTDKGWLTLEQALSVNGTFDINKLNQDVQFTANGIFQKNHTPWNKGKSYKLGPQNITEEERKRRSERASGENSNFWKGGVTSRKVLVSRKASRLLSRKVFERDNYSCKNCGRNQKLHAHHIIPIYQDPSKALDMENLITLCRPCHTYLHANNLEESFATGKGFVISEEWKNKYANKKTTKLVPKYVKVVSMEYVGMKQTYDLEVVGPYHNFVCNGMVVHNSHNGMSGRYRTMPTEFFAMPEDVSQALAKINEDFAFFVRNEYDYHCEQANEFYKRTVSKIKDAEKAGVITNSELKRVREFLRGVLPQHNMTERVTVMNLRSFANYMKLRHTDYAQPEIKEVARQMLEAVEKANVCPVALEALKRNGWNI